MKAEGVNKKQEAEAYGRLSEEHERLGRAVTRIVADYAAGLGAARVASDAMVADLERLFDEPLPREGQPVESVLAQFTRDVLPHAMNIPSPRYYGLFNPTPLPVAVWADALASGINQNGAAWRNSPSASVVEARVLRWLCEMMNYPPESFGTLTSGGSEANLIALKCMRDRKLPEAREQGLAGAQLVTYASEQCHYSFDKSLDILGLGRASLHKIVTEPRSWRVRVDALRRAIGEDLRGGGGRVPACVVGVAGATSTGAVDALDELAEVAREFGLWFHVDAAYGGALALSEQHRGLLRGIERADSVTFDPHKWMFVPFACGAALVRGGGRVLRDSFDITPEYLSEDRGGADVEYDFFRYGQLGTRRFNALKLWMAFKHLGTRGYAEIIDRHIELTRHFAARVDELEEFERVNETHTAVCCFRFAPRQLESLGAAERDRVQQMLQQRVERSGEAWVSTTVLGGARALRVNVNSFLTGRAHLDDLVELLRREGAHVLKEWEARGQV